MANWVQARSLDEVLKVFHAEGVAGAAVYDAQLLLADEHLRARGTWVTVEDDQLGSMTVQAPVARLSDTPARIDHLGRALGADNDTVYRGLLGIQDAHLHELRTAGAI